MRVTTMTHERMLCLILGGMLLLILPAKSTAQFADIIREPEIEQAIDEALRQASPDILRALEDAAKEVAAGTSDSRIQVAAADWYLSVLEKLTVTIDQSDPEDALRDTWILLRQVEASLATEQAISTFGASRLPLIRGTVDARSRVVGFARVNLTREQFNSIRLLTIEEERRRHGEDPGHRGFFNYGSRADSPEAQTAVGSFLTASGSALQAVPGSELAEGALRETFGMLGGAARLSGRAVGGVAGGVGTAAGLGGIEHVSQTVSRFPTDMRENVALILADENYLSTLASVDGISASTQEMAGAVDRLPEELRETLDKLEQTQPELQKTIQESDIAIKSVESVLVQAERVSQSLESTIRAAGETAEIGLRFIPEPKEVPEPREPKEPFRVESVTEAAEAAGATIAELRETLLSLHELIKEPQIPALASTVALESNAVVESTARTSRDLVDHITFRLWLLIVASLIALLLYHLVRHLMAAQFSNNRMSPPATES